LTRENWFVPTASKNEVVSRLKKGFQSCRAMIRSCDDKNKEGENKLDEKKRRVKKMKEHCSRCHQQPA
jgi:hypothetical protein